MSKDVKECPEFSDNIAVIGPGQLLATARKKLGFSQQDIATRLKLRLVLVENIEANIFDPLLPETFNRGYVCVFARLVNISKEDILTSYDTLSDAKTECSEMLSFSKTTQKEAQNSLLMWISYLIVAILIGSTLMWWLQGVDEKTSGTSNTTIASILTDKSENVVTVTVTQDKSPDSEIIPPVSAEKAVLNNALVIEHVDDTTTVEQVLTKATAIFMFTGDCWVSIYDATGERIAYGVKKAGYVMTIIGKPPFKVDIGRPALASIEFNGDSVDMSQFDKDNVAKFTLPIIIE